jgi:hypothetical protein
MNLVTANSRWIVALVLAALLGACSSTPHKVYDEEMSSEWSGKAYENLLVIGAYTDRPFRVGAESQFVEELKSRGVQATASYTLIPDTTDLDSNTEIQEKLATMPNDAVLIVATLDEGYDYDVGDYYATRGMVSLLGGQPGAATDMGAFISWAGSGKYSLYIGLWDVQQYKQVWQISTSSATTGSASEDMKALADFVVDTLRGKGML